MFGDAGVPLGCVFVLPFLDHSVCGGTIVSYPAGGGEVEFVCYISNTVQNL